MWNWIKANKTKLVGYGTASLGILSGIDATTAHYIEEVLGPHKGHQVASALMAVGGISTAIIGHMNSRK